MNRVFNFSQIFFVTVLLTVLNTQLLGDVSFTLDIENKSKKPLLLHYKTGRSASLAEDATWLHVPPDAKFTRLEPSKRMYLEKIKISTEGYQEGKYTQNFVIVAIGVYDAQTKKLLGKIFVSTNQPPLEKIYASIVNATTKSEGDIIDQLKYAPSDLDYSAHIIVNTDGNTLKGSSIDSVGLFEKEELEPKK
jgi:hypothetical protein